MYTVKIINHTDDGDVEEILHEFGNTEGRLVSAFSFTEAISEIPSASITVLPQNPCWDKLYEKKTRVQIINTNTNEAEFDGYILQIQSVSMSESGLFSKVLICEGALGWLCDSIQLYRIYADIAPMDFLDRILSLHNANFESQDPEDPKQNEWWKCFHKSGDKSGEGPFTTVYRNTLEEIKENLTENIGGEIMCGPRSDDGWNVIYYQEQFGSYKTQTVELAKNLKTISYGTDSTSVITRLVPLGAKIGDTEQRLTIEDVNDGKAYIDDENAIASYGIVMGQQEFDDITDAEELKTYATNWLQENNRIKKTYQAQVLDLSVLGSEADSFRVGNTYNFKCAPMGLDEDLRVIKRTVDGFKPYSPTIEIGDKTEKITDLLTETRKAIEYTIPKQMSTVLEQAKKSASESIKNSLGGYVMVHDTDDDGFPNEFLIMDTMDTATATQVWRWNKDGLGYSNSYDGTYGIAITPGGGIVADYITTGTMSADRILGGTMKIGAYNEKDGLIEVYDKSENLIAKISKSGIETWSGDFGFTVYDSSSNVIGKMNMDGIISYGTKFGCSSINDVYEARLLGGNVQLLKDGTVYGRIGVTSGIEDVDTGEYITTMDFNADNLHIGNAGGSGDPAVWIYGKKAAQSMTLKWLSGCYNAETTVVTDVWIDENGELQKTTDTIKYYCDATATWSERNVACGFILEQGY